MLFKQFIHSISPPAKGIYPKHNRFARPFPDYDFGRSVNPFSLPTDRGFLPAVALLGLEFGLLLLAKM